MQTTLQRWQVIFMACCTGLIVANIYYCQPLIVLISQDFGVGEAHAGTITFFTQVGYALGLLFLVPMGDMLEKRKQIVITTAATVVFLIMAALAPSMAVLNAASLLIGATSIVPQLILPLAAHLSPPEKRGKIIGIVMSGLLIGILLSRTISGYVGAWVGWRGMFWMAACLSGILLVVMHYVFPKSPSSYKGHYGTLMHSLIALTKTQPVLREAAAINALTFAGFGLFWTTMVLHLANAPFKFQSDTIGLFGLAAVAGALIAPLIGSVADKRNARVAIGFALPIVFISFFIFYIFGYSVMGMIAGIVLLDLGQQSVHISNQTRVYALLPEARNRLNTVYMTVSFVGTALGSAIGLWVWDRFGWTGICITGGIFLLCALAVYAATYKKPQSKV
jgi:predicted MFS family arabinose efflux permease